MNIAQSIGLGMTLASSVIMLVAHLVDRRFCTELTQRIWEQQAMCSSSIIPAGLTIFLLGFLF